MFQPIYKASRLVVGNPESPVAICCLWTKAKEIAKQTDPNNYCVIGNLFSAERGLDIMVRNLLANPNINNIIITGADSTFLNPTWVPHPGHGSLDTIPEASSTNFA